MALPDAKDFTLRDATTADVAALHALVNSAYRGDASRAGWTTEADLLGGQRTDEAALGDFIAAAITQGDRAMLIHTDDDANIDACVQLERRGNEAYLGMLTVHPNRQGSGVGKLLLTHTERYAIRRWQTTAIVMTVIVQRDELIAWYERRGYTRSGATAPFPYGDSRFGEPKRSDLQFVVLRKALA